MPTGKAAAQAGHAFLGAFTQAPKHLQDAYHADGIGTKITLQANLAQLNQLATAAPLRGIPAFTVVDSGHVCKPHFDGSKIITALGIGPVTKADAKFLSNLKLMENTNDLRRFEDSK